jgi:hypothetical protein
MIKQNSKSFVESKILNLTLTLREWSQQIFERMVFEERPTLVSFSNT